MSGALLRYRVMAWTVGALLLALVVVAIPLQLAHHDAAAHVGFTVHGYLFVLYLLTIADLGRRASWPVPRWIGLAAAGVVPGLSFWFERRVTRELA